MLKFRSRDEETKRVTHPAGHIALVGTEWVELPEMLHERALECGCITSDQAKSFGFVAGGKAPTAKTEDSITLADVKAAMKTMLESNDDTNFTTSGMPNKVTLNKMCSSRIPVELYDTAFAELQAESGLGGKETDNAGKPE